MGAQIVPSTGRGAYCFRIHGQIYHRTSHLHPDEAGGENTNTKHFNNIITHIRHVSRDLSGFFALLWPRNCAMSDNQLFLCSPVLRSSLSPATPDFLTDNPIIFSSSVCSVSSDPYVVAIYCICHYFFVRLFLALLSGHFSCHNCQSSFCSSVFFGSSV
ncbi:hypothetical protein AVEN_61507-1 [Araneus ventricosus]|uniref:Uncharacterized protein n=1 Tax=Araneus ventricosus TaxID=182803 RepID=A0A4Y2UTM8_ARAVE|nr:hypothetical protein AVEN_61507-1 [Araneus ventricosus]